MTKHDPLLSGFFSISDASDLLGRSQQSVRGWLNGYPNSVRGPVIERDFAGSRTVSFLDLMELRFIAFFRSQGVSMPTLRKAAERARIDWDVQHPLALASSKYVTDRKKVIAWSAEETGDDRAWDMATGQHEMWVTIEQTIERGVTFDPKTYLARIWAPKPGEFPNVLIDPRVAFGRPFVEGTSVPTRTLFRQWQADGHKAKVAAWFDVPEDAVETAISYELRVA